MNDKNKKIMLFLILAVVFVFGSLYFYNILNPRENESASMALLRKLEITKSKKLIGDNIEKFLLKDSFKELYTTKQYKELEEVTTFLNLSTGVGNSDPFYKIVGKSED